MSEDESHMVASDVEGKADYDLLDTHSLPGSEVDYVSSGTYD